MKNLKQLSCTKMIIIVNVIVFFIVELTGFSGDTHHMLQCGAAYAPYIEQGQYYRLVSSMFLHFGIEHLLNNMLVLYVIGEPLERTIGKARWLCVYFLGGLGGNLLSFFMETKDLNPAVSAGASGAVFALVGGMLAALLIHKGRIENLTIRQIVIMAAFSLYFGITSGGVDNYAHVGGLVCGFILALLLYRKKVEERW